MSGVALSPVMANAQSLVQALPEILGYVDGFLYQRGGQYHFGSGSLEVDFADAPVIETEDQTDFPRIDAASFASVASETRLIYTDRDREFKEAVAIHHEPAAHNLNGASAPLTLQRRWITRQTVANALVAKAGRRAALPAVSGTVMVLYSSAVALNPGDPFRLRPFPGADYLLNCRVTRKSHRRSDDAEIEIGFVLDVSGRISGHTPEAYTPPTQPTFDADLMPFERVVILPESLSGVAAPQVALAHLGVRAHGLITGYNVFVSTDDLDYRFLAQARAFAVSGTLTAELSDTATEATIAAHPVDRLTLQSQTPEQADADTVLMFLGDEILSVEGYVTQADGTVSLTNLRRARFGTIAATHASGDRAYLIAREHLAVLADPASIDGSGHFFKTTSFTIAKEQDIATAPTIPVDIPLAE